MGNGMQSAGLAGGPTTATAVIAPTGQSAILAGPLGAGATDIVTKIGSTAADASVNAAAELARIATGIFGTETKYFSFLKNQITVWGNAGLIKFDNSGANTWQVATDIAASTMRFGINTATYLQLRGSDGYAVSAFGFEVNPTLAAALIKTGAAGRIDQSGTDSTGVPGATTIDKPTGKSSIAAGAATVTITCNQCTAASRLMVTFHARDATGLLPIAVPGAGSFTVTTTANCTAALPFSWEISNIL